MPLPESVDSGPPVTGDVVVVSVTPREVLVAGGSVVTVGSPDTGSDGPPVERSLGADDDFVTQSESRQIRALVDAHRGRLEEAEQLAREAVAITDATDSWSVRGEAMA